MTFAGGASFNTNDGKKHSNCSTYDKYKFLKVGVAFIIFLTMQCIALY